jgi:hypothetical protein
MATTQLSVTKAAQTGSDGGTVIEIANPSDLTVKIIDFQKKTAYMLVDKDSLSDAHAYFFSMLRRGFREGSRPTITMEGDTLRSMEIWLRQFHGNLDLLPLSSISTTEIWDTLIVGHKYGFENERLLEWFAWWYNSKQEFLRKALAAVAATPDWVAKKDRKDKVERIMRRMLHPCFPFDHALGFQLLTRHLVYNLSGHLAEEIAATLRPGAVRLPDRAARKLCSAHHQVKKHY